MKLYDEVYGQDIAVERKLRTRTIYEYYWLEVDSKGQLISSQAETYIETMCVHLCLIFGVGEYMTELRIVRFGFLWENSSSAFEGEVHHTWASLLEAFGGKEVKVDRFMSGDGSLLMSKVSDNINVVGWGGVVLTVGVVEEGMVKDEGREFENSLLKKLDSLVSGFLSEASSKEDFTGKVDQFWMLRLPGLVSERVGLDELRHSASNTLNFSYFGK